MKKMLWLLVAVVAFGGGASGQTPTVTQPRPHVDVSAVLWNEHPIATSARNYGEIDRTINLLAVSVTNTGTHPVESVRVAFVFSDPDTGEELFRYKSRSKKRLMPGESKIVQKAVLARPSWVPTIDDLAVKSAVVTEVKYSDGSVWRPR